ncbi:hypothetical protein [Pseudomonas sp. R81]|uniref:hypothetical protein n=1 Tax=Pseudomonas sp. R81 TaxID=1144885 RepID=UPI00029A058C|nr:hypothetical protein [Pseudomonas sp. R81]
MANSARHFELPGPEEPYGLEQGIPEEITRAQGIEWGVCIDAYLLNAAKAGQRYAAEVYFDRSGVSENGMTVATPPLKCVEVRQGFKLMRSASGDNYVFASESAM